EVVAQHRVGDRPGRCAPGKVKRRWKTYALLQKPRAGERAALLGRCHVRQRRRNTGEGRSQGGNRPAPAPIAATTEALAEGPVGGACRVSPSWLNANRLQTEERGKAVSRGPVLS